MTVLPRTRSEARLRWSEPILLRQHPEGWRPDFPYPHYRLSMAARREQLAAWLEGTVLRNPLIA